MHGTATLTINLLPDKACDGFVEFRGVGAGEFVPEFWQNKTLNIVPDVRRPLIEPQDGKARNIYAPSVVETADGWRVFYGGWDGVATTNDRIYSLATRDFLALGNRRLEIDHGVFQHVCNVSATRTPDGGYALMCTSFPDSAGLNKPALFTSPDGTRWNGEPSPYKAQMKDVIAIQGYEKYPKADINGMNVILQEDGKQRLYFCDFGNFGKVFRASSENGRGHELDGVALAVHGMVNDVKKFCNGGRTTYLMGLHANTDGLWYALSDNGLQFNTSHSLLRHVDDSDNYIVALGWVTQGEQEQPGRRLLGVLYGAGAKASLDHNRIFASWLQKRLEWIPEKGVSRFGSRAMGPDRQLMSMPQFERGRVRIYAEDGQTVIGESGPVDLANGQSCMLVWTP